MWHRTLATGLVVAGFAISARPAELVDVRPVDEEYLLVHWRDGEIEYKDDGQGPRAFMGHEHSFEDKVRTYSPALDVTAAGQAGNYAIRSPHDAGYADPVTPVAVFRKTKVNGATHIRPKPWPEADYTLEHTLFLKLPRKLQQGGRYTLHMDACIGTDVTTREFVFDACQSVSEAIHVNLIGYHPDHTIMKSADLYLWLGDGGARDYSSYVGRTVILYDVTTGDKHPAGAVTFWRPSSPDYFGRNLTASPVWNCDFPAFTGRGTFRLVIEGIGCSPDFQLRPDIYFDPLKTAVRGFYYMRIGEPKDAAVPAPRQPRFLPGVDPPEFRVYRTTMSPWHPDWKKLGHDPWDNQDWAKYKEPGDPTNPNAWGGHSDALDWDRHCGHISIIYDLLLPFLLSNGQPADDDFGIRESGNGIPDLIDEARYEVDFFLRLRDGQGGYCAGLNNPPGHHGVMYQAAAKPYMAWANAANSAMLADALRVVKNTQLMARYRDEAIAAWRHAHEEDLDEQHHIGNGTMRGRDLKMLAAACLYHITGDPEYEEVVARESVCTTPHATLDDRDRYCQYWATAAYLMCARHQWQPIRHPLLLENMQACVLHEARVRNVGNTQQWPSRRSADPIYGWFQGIQQVTAVCLAHAIADTPDVGDQMLRALLLEADYGLGRNPMNMVHMTGLGSRHVEDIYTSGHNDGTPGVHPGHTPYMNEVPWGGDFMSDPRWYASRGYPPFEKWPYAEALWPARYCFANNEFTPQQTMRGKTLLYAYLYTLGKSR
jgi:hypothetical protein